MLMSGGQNHFLRYICADFLPKLKMATFPKLFFSLILLLVGHTTTTIAEFTCESTSCENGGVSIQFPFWLRLTNQSYRCGFPGFELSCSKTTNNLTQPQLLLTLPESGDFVVKLISLKDQTISINDPDRCLPNRIMRDHGLNLEGSPFRLSDYYTLLEFQFLYCPSNLTSLDLLQPISCLNWSSNNSDLVNYSVVAMISNPPFPTPWTSLCHLISTASLPIAGSNTPLWPWTDYYSDIQLQWDIPNCGGCAARGGRCGLLRDFNVACYDLPSHGQGLSKKAKYGLSIGLGIPGLIGIIGLTRMLCRKRNTPDQIRRRQTSTEFATLFMPAPPVVVMGLDGPSIESYPKTQLGESGRVPNPDNNVCSICLCEYRPKETLRTIPDCNHYFHVNCIDGWLKMNASCPLCRNLPERSCSFSTSLPLSSTS